MRNREQKASDKGKNTSLPTSVPVSPYAYKISLNQKLYLQDCRESV